MGPIYALKLCGTDDFCADVFAHATSFSTELPRSRRETKVPHAPA